MKKTFVITVALAAVFGVSACATIAKQAFQEPIVTFQDLQVEGIGLNGGTLDVILSVYNPNHFRLDATKLTYNLLIDSTTLGAGQYNSHLTVNEGDSTIVKLPVTLNYQGLSAAGRQLVGKGTVDYRVTGALTVATPIGDFSVPYDRTGRFSTFSGVSK